MPRKPKSSSAAKDLERAVGQLLIFGFNGTELSLRTRTFLAGVQPAGVILFKRNIESAQQTHALLRSAQSLVKEKMFLCVDLEGGTVDRLRDVVAPSPSVAEVVATRRPSLFLEHGRLIGRQAWALGFNVDFAPVLDLSSELSRSVLGTRTASQFPDETILYARGFLRGLRQAGVLGCGKHFPGLGEASLDSHVQLPVVTKAWKQLWQEDLVPYRMLKRELPFVMVAHCAYPGLADGGTPRQAPVRRPPGVQTPASLSYGWITQVLRRKIGYQGLIISDDLDMGGVAAEIGDAAVGTIQAGADLFLVCQKEENAWRAYYTVLGEAERNRRFRAQVEAAAQRVLRFKAAAEALQRRPAPSPSDADVAKLCREMWEFSEKLRLAAPLDAASGGQ